MLNMGAKASVKKHVVVLRIVSMVVEGTKVHVISFG